MRPEPKLREIHAGDVPLRGVSFLKYWINKCMESGVNIYSWLNGVGKEVDWTAVRMRLERQSNVYDDKAQVSCRHKRNV